ncbi:hypothetical protein HHL16_04830 [Pseudoflavitalea sp. G-6-1-2]|uniref:YCF48-related protein n=1 Tax=Pseudoflavitalea sp. G-6-1-2 TaxID=2728841 RepID=UPI00146BA287|nr:hypothetical protein [Pseudoflavitalea sp. G-6-1-2]NML20183.1 hypothetical protein [Pseudoflavitalea sp. G-6-1-2]
MNISLKFLVPAIVTAISAAGCVRGDNPIVRREDPRNSNGVKPIYGEGWKAQENVGVDYWDVFFPTDKLGFLAGMGSNTRGISRSEDGGLTWSKATTSGASGYYNLYFLNEDNGWAVGDSMISYTTDKGKTWKDMESIPLTSGGKKPVTADVYFPNKDTGYAVTAIGMLQSFDGGKNWSKIAASPTNVTAAAYYNTKDGIIGTTTGIRITDDSSKTYKNGTGSTSRIITIQLLGANEAVCIDQAGILWASTDKGLTWTKKLTFSDDYFDIAFSSLNEGYVMTRNKVWKISNGAVAGTLPVLYYPLFTDAQLMECHFLPDLSKGWVIYQDNILFRYVKP